MLYKPLGRGNDTAQYEEAAHRHDHLHGGIRSGNDADALAAVEDAAAEGAAAQQLPDDADGDQRQRVADALTQAVHSGRQNAILGGKCLRPAKDDTVHDDQRDEHAQILGQFGDKRLNGQIDHGVKPAMMVM